MLKCTKVHCAVKTNTDAKIKKKTIIRAAIADELKELKEKKRSVN